MRTHRTMALAATLSIAAAAAVTGLPTALAARADVSSSRLQASAEDPASAEKILAALRGCESSGDYTADNHDGYYGAYQFDVDTWQSLGYEGHADQAPPATQDQAVERLYARSGWDPWPACSVQLGLTSLALPELAPTPAASEPTIAAVPLTSVAVSETDAAPADTHPTPRRFRDMVAEYG